MAGQYAFSPKDDEAIIRHRLMTRVSVTRGEPPMRRLVKKLTALAAEILKDEEAEEDAGMEPDEDNGAGAPASSSRAVDLGPEREGEGDAARGADLAERSTAECERAAKAFLLELAAFEQPLLKTRAVIGACHRDQQRFQEIQGELEQQIEQAKGEIERLKVDLDEAKEYRKQEEECELVRRRIAQHPPRADSLAAIAALQAELEALERENVAGARLLDTRRKQFALLLHTMDELQGALDDSSDAEPHRMTSPPPANTGRVSKQITPTALQATPMQVD